jgi:two-component system, NtrC family, response regulator GlrR
MGDVNILLLDAAGARALGDEIEGLLRRHIQADVSRFELEARPQDVKIEKLFVRSIPRACFVIVPPEATLVSALLPRLRAVRPELPVLLVADPENASILNDCYDLGAVDILIGPVRVAELLFRLRRLLPESPNSDAGWAELKQQLGLKQFVGDSPAFQSAVRRIPRIAECDSSVTITGETGTGKEIFARAIHYLSARASCPFIPVNCGAIPLELVENELFGHTSGAYTGASSAAPGLAQAADGGTMFLDEVDALPAAAQVKLLRFLQEKEFRPLGSQKTLKADVRVIAATNSDLQGAIERGAFRHDLFYRLNVLTLTLPPLREREGDVVSLCWHFLNKFASQSRREGVSFSVDALEKLKQYTWPGNVRELENVIERSVVFAQGNSIKASDIQLPVSCQEPQEESFQAQKARMIAEFEQSYLRKMLAAHEHNISRAAKAAGKDRRAFWELMRKYDLHQGLRPSA